MNALQEERQKIIANYLTVGPLKYAWDGEDVTDWNVQNFLCRGFTLCNYEPGRVSLHGPPPQHGGFGTIYGQKAEVLGQVYDLHNYNIWHAHEFSWEVPFK